MRTRSWLVLAAATLVVVAAAAWSLWQRQSATTATVEPTLMFPGLAGRLNDVAVVEISGTKGVFRVEREADAWVVPEKSGYPARADKVKKTAIGLAELRTLEPRTDNPELYDRIAVGEPGKTGSDAVRIRLLDAKGGELAALIVGKVKTAETSARAAEIYVRRPADARSWLASARLAASGDILEWVEREMLRIERKRVADVVITHPDGENLRLAKKEGKEEEFDLQDIPAGLEVSSPYDVSATAGALEFISFDDVRRRADVALGEKVTRTRFGVASGLVIEAHTASVDGKHWVVFDVSAARPEAQKEADEIKARIAPWAFQIAEHKARELMRRMSDLTRKPEAKDGKPEAGRNGRAK